MKNDAASSSRTLVKATKMLAKQLRVKPERNGTPSEDFRAILSQVKPAGDELTPGELDELAEKFYRPGLRRGLIKASRLVLDGEWELRGDTLYSPSEVSIEVKVRLPSASKKKTRVYDFSATRLGFDD